MKITDIVTKDSTVHFVYFRDGNFIYEVNNFQFPVPIADVGKGTFLRDDKAIFFMRWIRQQLAVMQQTEAGT